MFTQYVLEPSQELLERFSLTDVFQGLEAAMKWRDVFCMLGHVNDLHADIDLSQVVGIVRAVNEKTGVVVLQDVHSPAYQIITDLEQAKVPLRLTYSGVIDTATKQMHVRFMMLVPKVPM